MKLQMRALFFSIFMCLPVVLFAGQKEWKLTRVDNPDVTLPCYSGRVFSKNGDDRLSLKSGLIYDSSVRQWVKEVKEVASIPFESCRVKGIKTINSKNCHILVQSKQNGVQDQNFFIEVTNAEDLKKWCTENRAKLSKTPFGCNNSSDSSFSSSSSSSSEEPIKPNISFTPCSEDHNRLDATATLIYDESKKGFFIQSKENTADVRLVDADGLKLMSSELSSIDKVEANLATHLMYQTKGGEGKLEISQSVYQKLVEVESSTPKDSTVTAKTDQPTEQTKSSSWLRLPTPAQFFTLGGIIIFIAWSAYYKIGPSNYGRALINVPMNFLNALKNIMLKRA